MRGPVLGVGVVAGTAHALAVDGQNTASRTTFSSAPAQDPGQPLTDRPVQQQRIHSRQDPPDRHQVRGPLPQAEGLTLGPADVGRARLMSAAHSLIAA
jgi:hypothetical protein